MPRELKRINGKWVWTGTHRSSDLEPAAPPPPKPQPPQSRPAAPRPQAPQRQPSPPKPWWEKVINDLKYEASTAGRYLDSGGFRDPTISGYLEFRSRGIKPEGLHQDLATGAVGAADNAIRAAYSQYQRHVEKVPEGQADPSRGRFGAALDSTVERIYQGLGATPPSEMTPQQRSADQFRRSLALNVALIPATRGMSLLPLVRGAASVAPQALRWGTELAVNEALSSYLDDNTGGNVVNMINDATGLKLPGGVDVGRADMVDAANQSVLPNAAAGQAIGAGLSAVVGLSARAFPNIRRSIRSHRAVEQELAERGRQEQMGLLQGDETGGSRFTDQAKRPPTMAEQNAAIDARIAKVTPSRGPTEAGPANASAENFAKPKDPEQALPEADPALDPWWDEAPDPNLPESTALGRSLAELSDEELRIVAEGQDLPVVERVNQVLGSRQGFLAPAPLNGRLVMASTDSLSEDYVASLGRALSGMEDWQLRRLFDPDLNPQIWNEAQAVSGVDDVAQLSRSDMLDTFWSLEAKGEVPMTSRMEGRAMAAVDSLTDSPPAPPSAPAFTLPRELSRSAPRYGMAQLSFASDLDKTAYILFNDSVKPSRSAPKFRAVVEASGLDLREVVAHGQKVKEAIKEAAGGGRAPQGEVDPIAIPAQQFGEAPPARPAPEAPANAEPNALDGVTRWDPSMEGSITVTRNPDGSSTVTDGRKRLAKARELGIPSLLTREGDSPQPPPAPRMSEEERFALKVRLLGEAISRKEVRPPDSPIPSLPDPPKVRLDDLGDGAITPGSKAAQAAADEVRLALEHARTDAAIQGEARAAAKEAMGWDLLPFEEKKRLGLGAGLGERQLTLPGMDEGGLAQPPTRPVDIRVSGEDFSEAPRGWTHVEPLPQLPPDQVELKTRLLASIVRKVAGQDVGVRFQETYIDKVRPREWGGDGVARMQSPGSYNVNDDLITLAGLGDGTAALGRQVEIAYHEAFHRIQYVALGAKDAAVLDTLWARVKTAIGSNHVGGTASGKPIAYSETQAVAFQRYAGAIAEGQDPVAAMLGGYDASATSIEKAVAQLASAFDRLLDFGEKVYNFFKNGTFDSTKGVFERARRGALAAAEGFEEAGSGFDRMTARADLGGWRATSWDLRRLERQIKANDDEIAEIRRKAAEDGC